MFTLFFPKAYAVTTDFGEFANLNEFVSDVLLKVVWVGYVLGGLVIIFAGFKMITSVGSPESITGAKSLMVGAVMGLILLYLISALFNFILP